MTQQVTVTSDAAVDMRPLVEAAIGRQLALIGLGITRTQSRIAKLEARAGVTSSEFERRLPSGDMAESLDLLELEGEIRTLKILETQEVALREARIG